MMAREIWELEIGRIRPNYRLVYEEEVILRLCDDIKARGLQEPIMVELVEYWFQIIDGEKRWRACKKLGFNKIRAIILEVSLSELNNL
jgi:ParB family chromosome partitioning protein